MLWPIYLNVSFKIVFQKLTIWIVLKGVYKFLKHFRNRILSAIEKLSCDIRCWPLDCIYGVSHKLSYKNRNFLIFQFFMNVFPFLKIKNEIVNQCCISSNLFHRLYVQLEMRNRFFPVWVHIRLLTNNYLIYEPGSAIWDRRGPNFVHACEFSLQLFKQEHEIPYCEYMVLHKNVNVFFRINSIIDFMFH
jgi:hypothetical protein